MLPLHLLASSTMMIDGRKYRLLVSLNKCFMRISALWASNTFDINYFAFLLYFDIVITYYALSL